MDNASALRHHGNVEWRHGGDVTWLRWRHGADTVCQSDGGRVSSAACRSVHTPGAAFSKVPRKILGKLLILLLLLLLLLLLHSFLLLWWTELIGLLVQCSTVALYPLDDVATCVSVTPKIRSFPKIFLGTFENAAPDCHLSLPSVQLLC